MGSKRVEQQQKLEEMLKRNDVSTLVLSGKTGVGKTWMVKRIINSLSNQDLIYDTVWLYLNKKYNKLSRLTDLARQLSLLPFADDRDKYDTKSEIEENTALENEMRIMISEKVKGLRSQLGSRHLFLVLDNVPIPGVMEKEKVLLELDELLKLKDDKLLKILITCKDKSSASIFEEIEIEEIQPLSKDESLHLLHEELCYEVKHMPKFNESAEVIVRNCGNIPAPILVIAKALNYIVDDNGNGGWTLERALEEASNPRHCVIDDTAETLVIPLMRYGFDLLPRNDSALINSCWHSRQFFRKNGGVHCNELIANWILEECFGPIDHVKKAYEQGHCVLMKLIDRHMLKVEDNIVFMEESACGVLDSRYDGIVWKPSLGLSGVYEDENWPGLGRVTPADDMIRTESNEELKKVPNHKNEFKRVSTMLLNGSYLCRQVIETYFLPMQDLQVLVILSPAIKSLPQSSTGLGKLCFLALKNCDLLERIDGLEKLKLLTVLEISGARNLKDIPPDIFKNLSKLQSLNLSETGIQDLPSSLSKLSELRSIILRKCYRLKSLPVLKNLKKLLFLDLSGATSLESFADKSIGALQDLQLLDLSQTQVTHFPFLKDLKELSCVSLRDCKKLSRLPILGKLKGLQVLDVSGALTLKVIQDGAFDKENDLKILDLSRTAITRLPISIIKLSNLELLNLSETSNLAELDDDTFKNMKYLHHLNLSKSSVEKLPSLTGLINLRELFLHECKLHRLPSLSALEKLEVLDLSGCVSFEALEDDSFEHMTFLRKLDLSNTNIEKIPSLFGLRNLGQLLLSNCINLRELPPLSSPKLQELNICGAKHLKEPEVKFPKYMYQLQNLNLSGTGVKSPLLNNYTNLRELSLRDCSELQTPLNLDNLSRLEVLDLSKTHISYLPSISKLCNLRKLLLRDCSNLQEIPSLEALVHLEVLDLQGAGIKELPMENLTHLTHLNLPNSIDGLEHDWNDIVSFHGELNWDHQCGIFNPSELQNIKNMPVITVRNMDSFRAMKGLPEIWHLCFKKCFVSVCPPENERQEDEEIYDLREKTSFRNVYFKTISYDDKFVPFLEIRGFKSFPTGVEDALKQAEYISLVENLFIRSLSELEEVNTLKGCWIESCPNFENLVLQGEEKKLKMWDSLEIFWLSNLPTLMCRSCQFERFGNLKQLYIDCCPQLETVFSSPKLPEKLEILHAKFCDRLQTLFRCESGEDYTLQNLHALNLVELPELTSIGFKFPSLRTAKIRNCPKLGSLHAEIGLANHSI